MEFSLSSVVKYVIPLIFIIIFAIIGIQPLKDFFRPVEYEFSEIKLNDDPKNTRTLYLLDVTMSTKRVFIPNDTIAVRVKVDVRDDIYNLVKNKELIVIFPKSYQSKTTKNIEDLNRKYPPGSLSIMYRRSNDRIEQLLEYINLNKVGKVLLRETSPKIFEGESQIYYKRPGNFNFIFQTPSENQVDRYSFFSENYIQIGTTADLNSKRMGDLALLISIMNIALIIYLALIGKNQ